MRRLAAITAVVVLVISSLFFAVTGLVYQEGDTGYYLVMKPAPSLLAEFGGGEADAWAKHNPGKALPWWQSPDMKVLAFGSWENNWSWDTLYDHVYVLTFLAWPVLAVVLLGRWLIRGRRRVGRLIRR